tara:strand:- start:410 stop:1315 length:906 start_codon:yes stop_codon:yes gene_type:complete
MIIHHHSDTLKGYHICVNKPLKYSDKFTFIPIKLQNESSYHKCIFQTPLLFTPFGSQVLMNGKRVIDLSFQNKENDKSHQVFLNKLRHIYQCVNHKYKDSYKVNEFLKETDFNECIRLKLNDNTSLYDENKNKINLIEKFTYGSFIIELEGMWLNGTNIWFQWNLLQASVKVNTNLQDYSFIDDIKEEDPNLTNIPKTPKTPDKYEKMLKLGVPKEAVSRQKILDGKIPPPPPPPPLGMPSKYKPSSSGLVKINALDLKSVVLRKGSSHIEKRIIKKELGSFEPPTLEELQTTLSKLRKTK